MKYIELLDLMQWVKSTIQRELAKKALATLAGGERLTAVLEEEQTEHDKNLLRTIVRTERQSGS